MNLLFAIVILISLIWGQVCTPAAPERLWETMGAATLLAAFAPAFAAFQVWTFKRTHSPQSARRRSKRFRAMTIVHGIVWAILSVSIVTLVRWIDVAFLIPQSLPLIDELVLVAPALLSLITSWAIFIYCLPGNTIAKKSRTSLFMVWLRMQVLMLVAPVLLAFFVSDCVLLMTTSQTQSGTVSQVIFWVMVSAVVIGAIVLYPRLMLAVWATRKVDDPLLAARCEALFERAGLRPRSVRVWQTNETIINAAAIGIVPGTEVIVVSDLLLKKFDDQEVDAILLHEMGHVRHRHCIKRLAMVIVPLFFLAMDQAMGLGLHSWIAKSDSLANVFGSMTQFLPAIAFLVYLWLVIKTVFRNMEYEADTFATETLFQMGASHAVHLALEKMAVIYPRMSKHRSGLHPSIRQRLAHILNVESRLVGELPADTLIAPVPAPRIISLDPITAK
jgi:Zn-dependent protease with chaperone function